MRKRTAICLFTLLEFATLRGITTTSAARKKPAPGINAEKIRAHVKYLSSDELEGRGTGQRGGDLAAGFKRDPRSQWSRPGRDSQTTLVARDRYASSHV
ncbi:MAG: hypothetical protein DME36_13855 [Verrucomicrobia bacterium]|nr:MAG: hypothetical protein DME36_13855 [Verrucomicrobiota bacterium]